MDEDPKQRRKPADQRRIGEPEAVIMLHHSKLAMERSHQLLESTHRRIAKSDNVLNRKLAGPKGEET